MSIYATWLMFDEDGTYDDGPPMGAPYVYKGSHVLPAAHDARGGWFCVNAIPNHITRDGRDDGSAGLHDWLLISVAGSDDAEAQDSLLTRPMVERLRDTLTAWLERSPDPDW